MLWNSNPPGGISDIVAGRSEYEQLCMSRDTEKCCKLQGHDEDQFNFSLKRHPALIQTLQSIVIVSIGPG